MRSHVSDINLEQNHLSMLPEMFKAVEASIFYLFFNFFYLFRIFIYFTFTI